MNLSKTDSSVANDFSLSIELIARLKLSSWSFIANPSVGCFHEDIILVTADIKKANFLPEAKFWSCQKTETLLFKKFLLQKFIPLVANFRFFGYFLKDFGVKKTDFWPKFCASIDFILNELLYTESFRDKERIFDQLKAKKATSMTMRDGHGDPFIGISICVLIIMIIGMIMR